MITKNQLQGAFGTLPAKIILKYAAGFTAGIIGLSYARLLLAKYNNPDLFYALVALVFIIAGYLIRNNRTEPAKQPAENTPPQPQTYSLNAILSRRELEVLEALLQNKSNPEIAQQLYISDSTLKTHITHIYKKLEVKNRKELFALVEKTNVFQSVK